MSVPRPFRAIAYVPDPTGQSLAGRRRVIAGRCAAATRAGLDAWIDRQKAAGNVVDVSEVLDLLDGLGHGSPGSTGSTGSG